MPFCSTTVPSWKNSEEIAIAASKYPPGLFRTSKTNPPKLSFLSLAVLIILSIAWFHSDTVRSPNRDILITATVFLFPAISPSKGQSTNSTSTLFTKMVSRFNDTSKGFCFPLSIVRITGSPFGPRIISTASGRVIPSVTRSIPFFSSLIFKIKSPASIPANLAGVSSKGAITTNLSSLKPN